MEDEKIEKMMNELSDIKDELYKFKEQRADIEEIKELLKSIVAHLGAEYHPK